MNSKKVVITVPVTGSFGDATNPVIPVTPKQIAESALEACEVGAAVVHIHVRDVNTGFPSMDFHLYKEAVQRIRDRSNMIINLSTGAGARFIPDNREPIGLAPGSTLCVPEKRIEHVLQLKPEICSLDVGSLNFGSFVFVNILSHVEWMAEQIRDIGIKPELEVFDLGHMEIAKHLLETDRVKRPPLFQLCMGIRWGIPATPANLLAMVQQLPSDAIWTAFGIAAASFPMVALSVLLGGHVRIGIEDTLHLAKGRPASSNKELVQKAVEIIQLLGKEPATPEEARSLLQIR
jgi:uncharacterized protein (DUF849 family)